MLIKFIFNCHIDWWSYELFLNHCKGSVQLIILIFCLATLRLWPHMQQVPQTAVTRIGFWHLSISRAPVYTATCMQFEGDLWKRGCDGEGARTCLGILVGLIYDDRQQFVCWFMAVINTTEGDTQKKTIDLRHSRNRRTYKTERNLPRETNLQH